MLSRNPVYYVQRTEQYESSEHNGYKYTKRSPSQADSAIEKGGREMNRGATSVKRKDSPDAIASSM